MNISSLIVDARAESSAAVRSEIAQWPGLQVHAATPEGKLVVTVESATDSQTTDTFSALQALPGVLAVSMVYHQFEPEPEQEAFHGTDAS